MERNICLNSTHEQYEYGSLQIARQHFDLIAPRSKRKGQRDLLVAVQRADGGHLAIVAQRHGVLVEVDDHAERVPGLEVSGRAVADLVAVALPQLPEVTAAAVHVVADRVEAQNAAQLGVPVPDRLLALGEVPHIETALL